MPQIPDSIVLKRDRDLVGRTGEIWVRRGVFALLCAIPILALLNVFGQRPSRLDAGADAAALDVYSPTRVRGGLIYEARFHVTARQDLKNATLVLDPGWLEGMTVNTIEPSPMNEGSDNGRLTLELGHIPKGGSHLLFVYFQVNPTNVGHRTQNTTLYDGNTELLTVHKSITVFP
jgi:hypothetical protein